MIYYWLVVVILSLLNLLSLYSQTELNRPVNSSETIAKNDVNLYVDKYGQYWMANSKYSFRTKYTHY